MTDRHGGEWRDEHPTPRPGPRAAQAAAWLNTDGDALACASCAAASCCSTSGPSAASTACTSSTSCARWRSSTPTSWSWSACTRRSSCTRPTRTRSRRRSSATPCTTPSSTTPSWSPGRPTPRGPGRRWCSSTRRATSSRSTPARATPTRSPPCWASWSRSTGPGAPCSRATRRTSRRRWSPATCGSRPRRCRCPAAACWSPTRGTTRSSSWPRRGGRSLRPLRGGFREPNGLCLLPDDVAAAGRVRRRGRRHRRTTSCAGSPSRPGEVRVLAGDGHQWMQGDGADRLSSALGRGVVAGPGVGRDGRHPPALDLRPAHRDRRGRGRHHQRGPARRPGRRGVVRADLRARARRRPAVARRQRDLVAALPRRRARRAGGQHRRRAPGCSTSASATARPGRRCSSTRSASPCCPTARWRCATPTTARSGGCDPATGEVTTLAADLAEPSGAYVEGDQLVVVESAAHRLTRVPLGAAGVRTDGFAHTHPAPGHRRRRPRWSWSSPSAAAGTEGRRPVRPARPS